MGLCFRDKITALAWKPMGDTPYERRLALSFSSSGRMWTRSIRSSHARVVPAHRRGLRHRQQNRRIGMTQAMWGAVQGELRVFQDRLHQAAHIRGVQWSSGLRHEQPGRKIRPTVLNGMPGRQLESNVSILVAIFP